MPLNRNVLPTIAVAAVVGLAVGVLIANGLLRSEAESSAASELELAGPIGGAPAMPEPPAAPESTVHDVETVISGDVVSLSELGPVRLLGVDTRQGPGGKPVVPEIPKALLQRILEGKKVFASYDPATADTAFQDETGLPLVYLTLDDGMLVNMEIVARGGAVADLTRDYEHRDDLVRAERDARWAGRGLWEIAVAKPLTPLPPSSLPSVQRPPTATPVPSDAVMVTGDGRFHRQSCSLAKGGIPMSPADARAKRYLACSQCFVSPKVKV